MPLPADLLEILRECPCLSRSYLVGGCVRDWLMGRSNTDMDIEVFGVGYEELTRQLSRWGKTDLVGRSFGVVKLTVSSGVTYDFTVPRRDSKTGPGHKGFHIALDPDIAPAEAAARRDFTINAMMYDPRRGELLDFFEGRKDLEERRLRHTSPAFAEDPLRVLRGMQFAGRFDLKPAPETVDLSRSIKAEYVDLAVERVWDEWFKWAKHSARPSRGLEFLEASEWIDHYPEIKSLRQTQQDPDWHPEGDVFAHTCHCCDAMAGLPEWRRADPDSRAVYMLAILTHDLGKPLTTHTAERNGRMRIVSPGHEEAGRLPAEQFLDRIHAPQAVRNRVVPLVLNHLAHLQPVTDRGVRRLARRLEPENIEGLCVVMTADHYGRPPKPMIAPESIQQLRLRAEALAVEKSAPKPILMGRHLLRAGWAPSPMFKRVLDAAYEAQLEGVFTDLNGGARWLAERADVDMPEEVLERLKTVASQD